MPRPPNLSLQPIAQPEPANERMKITDTMTLVVADSQGRELRVKDGGMLGNKSPHPQASGSDGTPVAANQATPTSANERTAKPGPEVAAVLNKVSFDDLRIGEKIGAGSQGSVRKVQSKQTGEIFALKSLTFTNDKEATREAVHHELVRIEALKHDNVVSSYEAFFREGKLYILMEYMDAGTMVSILKRREKIVGEKNFCGLPERRIALIAKHLLLGLAHLHASNVVHRDIKPANLLANTKGLAKISDFGVASSGESKMHMTTVGSTPYMSPERIKSQPYNTSCDIWSAGLTLAELALGVYPFGDIKFKIFELCQLIASGTAAVNWAAPPGGDADRFSPELKDFVAQCLLPSETRPGACELLNHAFVKKADGVDLVDQGKWFLNPTDDADAKKA
uniref:mitogen-activated protein kinase kinase n=1 Tax=Neobodo designis TaxID=312471 RepID=A0A7S1W5F8_NEODS|mmetsp:Transcript_53282/g.163916  ORF Transcript_53282/g.163916 Transcript_53282/m.163916 type:complete len:394 (+) Transcript_53282:226-1407(+)